MHITCELHAFKPLIYMETRRRTWEIHPTIVSRIMEVKPKHKAATEFLEDLLVKALHSGVAEFHLPGYIYLYNKQTKENKKQLEQEQNNHLKQSLNDYEISIHDRDLSQAIPENTPKKKTKKSPYVLSIPNELNFCHSQIEDFWSVKRKNKTEKAANFLFTQLLLIKESYGEKVVLEQLDLATAEAFQSITLKKYEAFLPRTNIHKQEEQQLNHPAYKEYKNPYKDPYKEEPTNDLVQELVK